MGGESIWGSEFEDEINENLIPLRGALCMANAGGGNTNGSQFFIVQSGAKDSTDKEEVSKMLDSYVQQYKQMTGLKLEAYNDVVVDNYLKQGGCLYLSGGYTVFGQVYEGLDVVDAIAATETDGGDKPTQDVIIESIEVSEYEG
ncbi:MAG: peptidylprolyl isomerase, partial [Clostridium sp.]|nr:peptidylprolyl isomerase [Clostridium sp.]